MFRKAALRLAIALVVVVPACAGQSVPTEASGAGEHRALAVPDAEVVAEDNAAREVGDPTEPSDDLCRAFVDDVTGSSGHALYDALGTPAQDDLLVALYRDFAPDGAAVAAAIGAFFSATEQPDMVAVGGHLDRLDALTEPTCGIPGGAALFAVMGGMAQVRFSCVATAIDQSEPASEEAPAACEDEEQLFPTSLPCFERTDSDWVSAYRNGGWAWETVDCEEGYPVHWEHSEQAWVDNFQPVDTPID